MENAMGMRIVTLAKIVVVLKMVSVIKELVKFLNVVQTLTARIKMAVL